MRHDHCGRENCEYEVLHSASLNGTVLGACRVDAARLDCERARADRLAARVEAIEAACERFETAHAAMLKAFGLSGYSGAAVEAMNKALDALLKVARKSRPAAGDGGGQ